jgi:outer membrane protein TolC
MNRFSARFLLTYPVLAVLISLMAVAGAKAQDTLTKSIDLKELVQVAIQKNPEIIAARNRWQSAQQNIEARGALPDPQVSYAYFVESVETRVGPQRHIFGVKQKFPFYNKRNLREEMAAKEAEAAKASYEAVTQEIVRKVKKAFYELFYVTKIIDITKNEKEILRRFEQIARTKYQTGEGSQQNILKVHVEITKLDDNLLSLHSRQQTAKATLNTLLDRETRSPLGKPSKPDFRDFADTKQDLFQMARENRPELHAAASFIEKSDSAYRLAKKDYYPDLTIGANYIEVGEGPLPVSDNGKDAFNVMFSINVPIWRNRLSSKADSALQMIKAQQSRYENLLNGVLLEVEDGYFKILAARDTLNLYKNVLIPQAEQSLKSAEAGYIAGIVIFLDLLDAERVLLKIQYAYWKTYTDYFKHVADMERAVGMQFTENLARHSASNAEEG